MGPDDGWRYHDPHHWGPGLHHHGPPPWIDGPDPHWSIAPILFPLLLVLWTLYRWYALDRFAASGGRWLAARRDTVRPRWDAASGKEASP